MRAIEFTFSRAEDRYSITVLEEFFDCYGLYHARNEIEMMLEQASIGRYFKDRKLPMKMLVLGEWLQKLVPAFVRVAAACSFEETFNVSLRADGRPDLSIKADYMMHPSSMKDWEDMPRHLTPAEYAAPIAVLEKIGKYRSAEEWKILLYDLLEYSLSCNSVDNVYPGFNILKLRKKLLRAVEAGYLVVVRYRSYLASTLLTEPVKDPEG